jgi:CRP-like cAMP-binding protein
MTEGNLGRQYPAGEIIIHQGDVGNYMYVIQEGVVEVFRHDKGQEILLAELKEGDMIGEMAIFENEVRSASVRAKTDARLLTVDKKNFLRRIHNDPSLAYKLVQKLSRRIREMNEEVVRLRSQVD